MKRILLLSLSFLLAVSFSGCHKEDVEISEEDALDTKYEVVAEGFDFDLTPSNDPYLNDGYIVKSNGLFGFIGSDGEFIMQPEYESVYINPYAIETKNYIYMFRDRNNETVNSGEALAYFMGYTDNIVCGTGIGGVTGLLFIDQENTIMRYMPGIISEPELSSVEYLDEGEKMLIPKIYEEYTKEMLDEYEFKDWYIAKSNKEIIGPYVEGEKPYFYSRDWDDHYWTMEIAPIVHGMFYEHAEKGYRVWNITADKYYDEVVDEAIPLSFNAMKIVKDSKMGVIDSDLNLVLFGDFEDVTLPIDGHAFVKLDGDWKLIKIK